MMARHCSRLHSLHAEDPESVTSASPWVRPANNGLEESVPIGAAAERRMTHHENFDFRNVLEPLFERRRRYISLSIVIFAALTFNLSFSIINSYTEKYIGQMDLEAETRFFAILMAVKHLTQFITSPLIGFLSDKTGSIRLLSIIGSAILASGFVLYATVSAFPEPRRWYALGACFVVGTASGSTTLFFSYVASSTTKLERTTAFSFLNFAGSITFILGPVIKWAFSPLGTETGFSLGFGLYLNHFSGPFWLSAALGLICTLLFLPCSFSEYNIARREDELLAERAQRRKCKTCTTLCNTASSNRRVRKPDKWALFVCIVIFASVHFSFIFLERIATLLTVEHFGLNETDAALAVEVAFVGAAILSGIIYVSLGPWARKMNERVILTLGIVFLILGPLSLNPLPGPAPPLKLSSNLSNYLQEELALLDIDTFDSFLDQEIPTNDSSSSSIEIPFDESAQTLLTNVTGGCPFYKQPWCLSTPAVRREQFIVGFLFIATGFPIGVAITSSIFSKILGPHPQGTWMGLMVSGVCLAQVVGPIGVNTLYSTYGPWAAFGLVSAVMIGVLFILLVNFERLIPFSYENETDVNHTNRRSSHSVPYALRPAPR